MTTLSFLGKGWVCVNRIGRGNYFHRVSDEVGMRTPSGHFPIS